MPSTPVSLSAAWPDHARRSTRVQSALSSHSRDRKIACTMAVTCFALCARLGPPAHAHRRPHPGLPARQAGTLRPRRRSGGAWRLAAHAMDNPGSELGLAPGCGPHGSSAARPPCYSCSPCPPRSSRSALASLYLYAASACRRRSLAAPRRDCAGNTRKRAVNLDISSHKSEERHGGLFF